MFYELNRSKIFLFGFGLNVLKKGIKNRNSALNRVRVRGAGPHLPTQGYIEYFPPVVAQLVFLLVWKLLAGL